MIEDDNGLEVSGGMKVANFELDGMEMVHQ